MNSVSKNYSEVLNLHVSMSVTTYCLGPVASYVCFARSYPFLPAISPWRKVHRRLTRQTPHISHRPSYTVTTVMWPSPTIERRRPIAVIMFIIIRPTTWAIRSTGITSSIHVSITLTMHSTCLGQTALLTKFAQSSQ